jgi:hypothetical protein
VWEAPARDGWPLRLPFLLLILGLAGLAASFLSSCGLGSSCPLLPRRFLLRTWLIVTNLACLKREDNRGMLIIGKFCKQILLDLYLYSCGKNNDNISMRMQKQILLDSFAFVFALVHKRSCL